MADDPQSAWKVVDPSAAWTPVAANAPTTPAADETKPLPKITPGMKDADVIRAFGYDPDKIMQSPLYKANHKLHGDDGLSRSPDVGGGKGIISDTDKRAAMGVSDIFKGATQLLAHGAAKVGAITDNTKDYFDLLVKLDEANYQQNVRHGDTSADVVRGVAGVAPALLTGQPETLLGRAGLGGLIAATAKPETGDTSHFFADKAKQAATGAVLTPVAEGLTALAGKGVNAVADRLAAAKTGALPAAAQEVENLAAQYKVPVTAGDVSGRTFLQKTEQQLEQVPMAGMGKFRVEQQQATRNAAAGYLDQVKKAAAETPHVEQQMIADAAAKGNKGAIALQQEIANAGDDYHAIIANSGHAEVLTRKLKADALYGRVERLAEDEGAVPLKNTLAAVSAARKELESAAVPDKSALSLINTLETRLAGKEIPAGAQVAETNMGKIFSTDAGKTWQEAGPPLADTSFRNIRALSSELGEKVSTFYRGEDAVTGSAGVGHIQSIKNAVRRDLDAFAGDSERPELKAAWQKADDYYRNNLVPFKARKLASAFSKETLPDEIYKRFVTSNQGEDGAQQFYNALDAKGQGAVRAGIVQQAYDKALNEQNGIFSPVKFASAIRKTADVNKVFFRESQKAELDGFVKLMDHVTRAGQYAENPPTGARAIPFMLGGFAAHNPVGGAAAVGLAKGAVRLTTTAEGRRLLLTAATAKAGTQKMDKVVAQIIKLYPGLLGEAAGRTK